MQKMVDLRDLPKELEDIARNELNEVPCRVSQDIAHIREWLLKQPHIKARTDVSTLLLFLRSCKFSLEKTKRKLDLFYAAKSAFPDLFTNRDPYEKLIRQFCQKKIISILPSTSTGPVVIAVRLEKLDINIMSMNEVLKMYLMAFEVTLRNHVNASVVGGILLVDAKNMSLKYLSQLTPQMLKKSAICFENVFPLRVKRFLILNLPSFVFHIFDIFKTFLSEKLRNRIVFAFTDGHGSNEFELNFLPKEYGGKLGSLEQCASQFNSQLESFRDWFLEDEQYRSTEVKKVLSSKLNIDLFSLEGSFRKLEVD